MIHPPFAYVGPGAGFAFLGSFLALVLSALAGLVSLILWPFRMVWRLLRGSGAARGPVRRVIVIQFSNAGEAVWQSASTFAADSTGATTNRAQDAILPHNFWETLREHKIECTLIGIANTWPPPNAATRVLSGQGTPDVTGSRGHFSLFTKRALTRALEGGSRYPLIEIDGVLHGELRGFGATIPFQIADPDSTAGLRIQNVDLELPTGRQSEWLRLKFGKTRAIARFTILAIGEDFQLYVTPLQIDPEDPTQPISHPAWYSTYSARLLGPFWTLGETGDVAAFRSGVLTPEQVDEQVQSILAEREAIFFNTVQHLERGVVACRFDVEHTPGFAASLLQRVTRYSDQTTRVFAVRDAEMERLGSTLFRIFGIG